MGVLVGGVVISVYSHQIHIYLKVSGISVKKPLQNIKIVEKQLDV